MYGDHGPYVELDPRHVQLAAFPKVKIKGRFAYYNERRTADDAVMLYVQRKSVAKVPNPPRNGLLSVPNNRKEGYADYKP